MTIAEAKAKHRAWLLSQLKYHEGENNWNKYAEDPDLIKLIGWKPQKEPWCDTFTDESFIACFGLAAASAMTYQPIGKGSAACRYSAAFFKEHGAFFRSPELNDVIFFYSGGEINHQGCVVEIRDGKVITVEGNRSDAVGQGVYALNDARIAGYGRPDWSVVAEQDETSGAENPAEEIPVADEAAKPGDSFKLEYHILRIGAGMTGQEQLREEVRAVQQRLRWMGFDIGPDGADGEYGDNTAAAVRQYQRSVGLQADGEFGPLTRGRMDGVSV